jgi:hypothetical protein
MVLKDAKRTVAEEKASGAVSRKGDSIPETKEGPAAEVSMIGCGQ